MKKPMMVMTQSNGLVDILKPVLSNKDANTAFVFGSLAKAEETAESDIDLMVICNISLRKHSSLLSGLTERTGREINPHVFKQAEYLKRRDSGDHFVTQVLAGRKIFIVGTEDDFEAMGK